jgi:pyruvate,water dikinase
VSLATTPRGPTTVAVDADQLRDRVPSSDRAEFDRLLADARFTYGLRDDNGGLTGAWPVGLLRRAMLEIGRRLEARGALHTAAHAVEVELEALLGLLDNRTGPSADEIAARAADRAAASRRHAPARLGPPLPGVDAVAGFPEPLGLMLRAQLALADGSYHLGDEPLAGLGLGDGAATGRACVAADAADALARLCPGDILVTRSTTPAFNAALSIAGGLVVEEGGYISHAAVMARELGLPAVIGAAGAVAAIPDGAIVEVDPANGLVRQLDAASAL